MRRMRQVVQPQGEPEAAHLIQAQQESGELSCGDDDDDDDDDGYPAS